MELITTAAKVVTMLYSIYALCGFGGVCEPNSVWKSLETELFVMDQPIKFDVEALSVHIPVEDFVPITFEDRVYAMVDEICSGYDAVDPAIVKALIWVESRYDPNAENYNGTCVGLMQVSTKWHADRAARLGLTDFFDPYSNIAIGVDYLQELMTKYKDPSLALMAYNMGDAKALRLYRSGKVSKYAKTITEMASVGVTGMGDI